MAEALVAGAFLSGFVNVLFDRLLSPEAVNLIQGKKLDQELVERLKSALCAAEALLVDAEQKQFHSQTVKDWLDSFKDAVYVADDLLERVITEAATQQEVSNFLPPFFNFKDREMVIEMENIVRRIEDIEKRRYILGLEKISRRENLSWRTPSTSLVGGGPLYGRENDQEAITNMLMDDSSEGKISVIPVVGLGGVGKTTLARWVYNNEKLMKKFDMKAWICVSEEFDVVKITKRIREAVISGPCYKEDLNLLQLELKEKLTGKKFFIVLDDVWNNDRNLWDDLQKPFQCGAKGSKILVTTRSKDVASVVQTGRPYTLNELRDEYCWSVFANNADFPESNGNPTLEAIGRKIVEKCKGLPFAAETLGRLLRTKDDINDWNTILTSDIWGFSVTDSKIIPALLISYYHLPSYLKRCFVYCSLYPKDYEFDKDELILLWMAEDLLPTPKRGETLEKVGYNCFDDLASRLFFKQFSSDDNSFVIHDLVHDVAIFVAGDFYCTLEELGKATDISLCTRHLSYKTLSHPISNNFDVVGRAKSLRTFLQINFSPPSFSFESAASIIPSKFPYLRVLSFCECTELEALPHSIGELIHLRYLDLSETSIKTLPESLSNLYNLQTLKLYGCHCLTVLPSGMQNLVNLRHLDVSGTALKEMPRGMQNLVNLRHLDVSGTALKEMPSGMQNLVNLRHLDVRGTALKEMPRGMSKLKHLQFLSDFVVGKHEENGIKELGELSNLHRSFSISKLENVTSSREAFEARIMDKRHIETLSFKWSWGVDMVLDSQTEREIFGELQPHRDLQNLIIDGYRGTLFPIWVGQSSYQNMTHVSLGSCNNCCMLPSLGTLPSLNSLEISNFKDLNVIGAEFYKNDDDHSSLMTPFPSLESLSFDDMSSWEMWHSCEFNAFPQLKHLQIYDCPKLIGDLPNHLPALKILDVIDCPCLTGHLPNHLPDLETLEIHSCDRLVSSLPRAPTIRELSIYESDEVWLQEIPLLLQSLAISGFQLVESMFQVMNISQPFCLLSLHISGCPSAISFSGGCIPFSVKTLIIRNCRKLEFPRQQQHQRLHSLQIYSSCDSLISFPLESFPNLNSLEFRDCKNLESLSVSQSQVAALHHLDIYNCPNFVSFPREGLDAPNMNVIWVTKCEKLKSLPCRMNTLLPKLQQLRIRECPEINSFPDGCLPPNLGTLVIENCEKLLSGLSSMGVHEGLTCLDIGGPCESVKSLSREGLALPKLPSLTSLILSRFSSLETLDCKELIHCSCLQLLSIRSCPMLENMAGERLPASLLKLEIVNSPLLEEWCKMKHPQIWPKISHIPGIKVDWRWIS